MDTNERIAIVTGANSGLGFETTKELASKGFRVIMACRNLVKAEAAKNIIQNSSTPVCRTERSAASALCRRNEGCFAPN